MIPIMMLGIKTRVVEELLSSRIASVIKIGTHIAIVNASIISNINQILELNSGSNMALLKKEVISIFMVGNAIKTIIDFTALTNMKGVNAHSSILNLYDPSIFSIVPPLYILNGLISDSLYFSFSFLSPPNLLSNLSVNPTA